MRDSVVKKLASSELQRQWRAKNLIGELSIFYDDDNMRERLDEIWEGLLKTRGGGVVTILATEDYFYQTWCLAELMAAKLLYECPDEKERIRLCFIAVGMTVNEVKENWFMKEHAPDLVTGNNAIRVYEIPLPQVSGRAEMDSAVNNLVNSIAETVVELGSKSLAVGKGQEASFHVMKEVVHRSFLGSTEYNSLLPIMAHDMHVIFQHLKDFLANKGDSNAKDALNAYERKWLSDWSRRDWSMRKNELVDCLKQAEALPKPSLKVSLKRKYNDANLTTRDHSHQTHYFLHLQFFTAEKMKWKSLAKPLMPEDAWLLWLVGLAWVKLTVQVILLINGYNKMWHIALYCGSSQTQKILFESAI
jgi:hypothetical protein